MTGDVSKIELVTYEVYRCPRLKTTDSYKNEEMTHGMISLGVKLNHIGGTHCTGPHPVGFGITDKLSLVEIELQVPLQLLANIRGQTDVHGSNHDVRIGYR